MMESFEAIVAVYGVVSEEGQVLTRQAAIGMFDKLRQQETMKVDGTDYRIADVRMEGDGKQGRIVAQFEKRHYASQ